MASQHESIGLSIDTYEVSNVRTMRAALADSNACGFGFAASVKYSSEAKCALGRTELLKSTDPTWPAAYLEQGECGSQAGAVSQEEHWVMQA